MLAESGEILGQWKSKDKQDTCTSIGSTGSLLILAFLVTHDSREFCTMDAGMVVLLTEKICEVVGDLLFNLLII